MKGEFTKLLEQARLNLDEFEQEKQQILIEKERLIYENHKNDENRIDLENTVKNLR